MALGLLSLRLLCLRAPPSSYLHACASCMRAQLTVWSVRRKSEMDKHVAKALDHLIQNKLLFAEGYRLEAVQCCKGAHGLVQRARTAAGSSHMQVCSQDVHV
jgi:hypothetical protein